MGKPSLVDRFKMMVGCVSWHLFLWSVDCTQEEYWHSIYLQEIPFEVGKEK